MNATTTSQCTAFVVICARMSDLFCLSSPHRYRQEHMLLIPTVALKYTLSRFEVVGDSTELSSVQQLRPAQMNSAQLSWTQLSSVELSSAQMNSAQLRWTELSWTELSWITHNLEPTKCVPQGHRRYHIAGNICWCKLSYELPYFKFVGSNTCFLMHAALFKIYNTLKGSAAWQVIY